MSPESSRCLLVLALTLSVAPSLAAQPQFVLDPLVRVDSPSAAQTLRSSDSFGPSRFVYRNDGDLAITAWDHRCVVTTTDGRTGWSGVVQDSFTRLFLPAGDRQRSVADDGLVVPGETFEVNVGGGFVKDGPYATQTCGIVALILEDGSSRGAPKPLESMFASRRAWVADIGRAASNLKEVLRLGNVDPPRTRSMLEKAASTGHNSSELSELLGVFDQTGRLPRDRIEAAVQRLDDEYRQGLQHLRPVDRRALEARP